jgi:signal transduction histidine kinase
MGVPTITGEFAELDIVRKDGKPALAELRVLQAEWCGEPAYLLTIRDTTLEHQASGERLRHEQERRNTTEALMMAERIAASSRVAAALAHEINNPLMAVSNLLFLLHGNTSLDTGARELLAIAEQEVSRVGQITQLALNFSRSNSKAEPLRLSAVLDDVLLLYRKNIEHAQVRVEKRYDFEGELLTESGGIRQVLTNLVLNAIDAAGSGGILKLHVYDTPDWRHGGRRGVRVVVADNGSGIPQEHRDKLFQPFFTSKGTKGTGLGLWVSRGIVAKLGGSLKYRTSTRAARRGTSFSVFLPLPTSGGSVTEGISR